MNLKELRDFINSPEVKALPDDTPVGAVGHCGEFCEALSDDLEVRVMNKKWFRNERPFTAIIIPAIDIGEEPD